MGELLEAALGTMGPAAPQGNVVLQAWAQAFPPAELPAQAVYMKGTRCYVKVGHDVRRHQYQVQHDAMLQRLQAKIVALGGRPEEVTKLCFV